MRRMTPLRTEDRPKFFRDRPGWMGYPEWKMPSGLYIAVRSEGIFRFGISQSPGPILISRQVFVLARNRYNSGSSLYFVRGGSEIISSDAVQNGKSTEIINLLLSVIYCNLSLAEMQRLFRGRKYLSGLYADGMFRTEYFFI